MAIEAGLASAQLCSPGQALTALGTSRWDSAGPSLAFSGAWCFLRPAETKAHRARPDSAPRTRSSREQIWGPGRDSGGCGAEPHTPGLRGAAAPGREEAAPHLRWSAQGRPGALAVGLSPPRGRSGCRTGPAPEQLPCVLGRPASDWKVKILSGRIEVFLLRPLPDAATGQLQGPRVAGAV